MKKVIKEKQTKKSVSKTKVVRKSNFSADVFDLEGKPTETIELSKDFFETKVNNRLISQAARVYLANQRQGTVSTKTRGEVNGSTRKIYRQKGTGRARHGSLKAPIFVGGGTIFGPRPRDFSLKLPQKMKFKALFYTLASRFQNKDILIVNDFEKKITKTKDIINILKSLQCGVSQGKLLTKTLFVSPVFPEDILRASRNIENLTLVPLRLLNSLLILSNPKILLTKKAIEEISERWKTEKS